MEEKKPLTWLAGKCELLVSEIGPLTFSDICKILNSITLYVMMSV